MLAPGFLGRIQQVLFQAGVDAIDDLADLGPRIGFCADLIEDQTACAGVVELVKPTGGDVDCLVFA
jgi:hypothetical protein